MKYASPEQFKGGGGEEVDGRSDLYSLGVVLYELAGGEHPHPGDSFEAVLARVLTEDPRRLGEVNPQVSPFFEEVVHTLLARDRTKRFASAEELLAVLTEGEQGSWWPERARAIRARTKRPLRRIRIPRETAVYGREAELAALRAHYDAAKAGDGGADAAAADEPDGPPPPRAEGPRAAPGGRLPLAASRGGAFRPHRRQVRRQPVLRVRDHPGAEGGAVHLPAAGVYFKATAQVSGSPRPTTS